MDNEQVPFSEGSFGDLGWLNWFEGRHLLLIPGWSKIQGTSPTKNNRLIFVI